MQVRASTINTAVQMRDQTKASGRVTVFDAKTGRQIANGRTGRKYKGVGVPANGDPSYIFTSSNDQEFVAAVLTDGGFIGSARGRAGQLITVNVYQSVRGKCSCPFRFCLAYYR